MLSWTADFPSAHQDGKLPVLDVCMWTEERVGGTVLEYEFYSKSMANPVTIPADSAISNSMKISTYRQEVFRVLANTSVSLPWERKAELLTNMVCRMEQSGYNTGFIVTAINGGIRAHLKVLANYQENGTPVHRPKDWEGRRKRSKKRNDWFQQGGGEGGNQVYSSFVFVPSTPGSTLAKLLQYQEAQNNQGRTHRFRIVEKTGVSVRDYLARNYPWEVTKCHQDDCFQCSTCPDPRVSCRKPGIGYTIRCLKCNQSGVKSVYEGESSKNAYARGKRHLQELKSGVRTNAMVIHNIAHHDSSKDNHFQMSVVKLISNPLNRQIDESLRIKDSDADIILNSGSEWRGDRVPRASFQSNRSTAMDTQTDRGSGLH